MFVEVASLYCITMVFGLIQSIMIIIIILYVFLQKKDEIKKAAKQELPYTFEGKRNGAR